MRSAGLWLVQAHLALDSSVRAVFIVKICQRYCHLGACLHLSLSDAGIKTALKYEYLTCFGIFMFVNST